MKILIPALLLTNACALVVPAASTIAIYKGSQIANHATGGQDGLTLTEQSFQRCQTQKNCTEDYLYTAVFFPVDVVATTITGRPDLIGSHGAVWHELDKSIPTISNVQASYGGHNYNQFIGANNGN